MSDIRLRMVVTADARPIVAVLYLVPYFYRAMPDIRPTRAILYLMADLTKWPPFTWNKV